MTPELERQVRKLEAAEMTLGVDTHGMRELLGVPVGTYRKWREGYRKMPAVAVRCLELVIKTEGKL